MNQFVRPASQLEAAIVPLGASLLFAAYCKLHTLIEGGQAPLSTSLSWGVLAGAPAGLLAWWVWRMAPKLVKEARHSYQRTVLLAGVFAAIILGGAFIRLGFQGFSSWRALPGSIFDLLPFAALGAVLTALVSRPQPHAVSVDLNQDWLEIPGNQVLRVRLGDVDLIKAAGNYCEVRAVGRSHLVRIPLRDLASKFDHRGLVQIHRSAAVNLKRVVAVNSQPPRGRLVVRLDNGEAVVVGAAYATALMARLAASSHD
jgi:hypothetical protein